jgi:hypothetical protein
MVDVDDPDIDDEDDDNDDAHYNKIVMTVQQLLILW